jgi:multidrug efflux pump subunit AcrA (membrane-fusion protein)
VLLVLVVATLTTIVVQREHKIGQLDVISAQAMDMSQMRPPAGAAPVQLAAVCSGALGDTVTYTGTVQAYNTQDIAPRITGQLVSLPVYPGQTVRAGQVVAQLDTAEVDAKVAQASAEVRGAELSQRIAELNHHQHHRAALEQAASETAAAQAGVADARAEAKAAGDAVGDAQAAQTSAQASADYWKTEIAREKQLADAGAASRQEYQQELSQAQAADAALASARLKVEQAQAMAVADQAKVQQSERNVDAAQAMQRMASADLALAREQAAQAETGAMASRAAERQAAVIAGYARIVSPSAGVVTDRLVSPGMLVQPGTVLLRVAEIDRVRIQAHVAVTDVADVAPGATVQIVPQATSAKPFAATVTSVFPSADAMSRTAIVEAVVPNPRHVLLPGAFVTMRLSKHAVRGGLQVPSEAVVYRGGKPSVWIASGGATGNSTTAEPHQYECVICHMRYSAADAKKHGYKDPMDGGKLVPVAPEPSGGASTTNMTVRQVPVTVGASDGTSTEVSAASLSVGDRVVTRGQAGLSEGAVVVRVAAWGDAGPETLPTAGQAMQGVTRYRCLVCGMTYSADDARKNGYVDPMDGGKLVPVTGGAR